MGIRFVASADGKFAAYAISNRVVQVMDLAPGTEVWNFLATEELTTAMAFSPNGNILATGGGYTESTIKLWNVSTRQFIGQLDGHRSWIEWLKFLPDGNLASASADQTIRLWDVAARRPLRTLRGHRSEVRSLDVSRDGRTLASGGKDGTVLLWDLASLKASPPGWQTIDPKYQPGKVRGFEFSPDSRTVAVIEDDAVKLYDTAKLEPLPAPNLGLTNITAQVAFSHDSRLLVAVDAHGRVGVYDLSGRHRVTNFLAHAGPAGLLGSVSERGRQSLLTWGRDNIGREWDFTTWKEISHWPLRAKAIPPPDIISSASASGFLAMKLSDESTIQLFTASEPMERRTLACPFRSVGVALSPDEKTLASACEDGTVRLWDTRTLAGLGMLRGVLLGFHSVAFSPDGKRIAAGSNGKEAIKIWDFDSQEELVTLEGRGSLFYSASFSSDGNMLAARGWSGILHLWRAPSLEEINTKEQSHVSER